MDSESQKQKGRSGFFERFSSSSKNGTSTHSTEKEVRDAVGFSSELTSAEKRMINEIIDLGDTIAGEICTPRVDVMLVHDDESGRAALERMRGTGYSRLPVCHEDIDDVVGIVNFKDLIGPLIDGSVDDSVDNFMYTPMFVPETKDVIALLGEMQAEHCSMAVVIDEYGGTRGILTIEDILEEIVGDIADESDMQGDKVVSVGDNSWRASGRLSVEDAQSLGWPVIASQDYETIAGWLMSELGSVPKAGDHVVVDAYTFTVVRMRRSRITVVKVERNANEAQGDKA